MDPADYRRLLARLETCVDDHDIRLYAYCLLGNHYHLICETPKANISSFMRAVGTGYNLYYNKRHRKTGYVTQGRFRAKVEGDEYLLKLTRYVHLYPVRTREFEGLVAVLASLLIPGLKRALSTAHRAACLSNMRQFGAAIHLYGANEDGKMPPIWERGFYGAPSRDFAEPGGVSPCSGCSCRPNCCLPSCFAARPTRATTRSARKPFTCRSTSARMDYSRPHEHRYSYGAVNLGYYRSDRRIAWSIPEGTLPWGKAPHLGQIGSDSIPNPTALHLVWDAHIPSSTRMEGWPRWSRSRRSSGRPGSMGACTRPGSGTR